MPKTKSHKYDARFHLTPQLIPEGGGASTAVLKLEDMLRATR